MEEILNPYGTAGLVIWMIVGGWYSRIYIIYNKRLISLEYLIGAILLFISVCGIPHSFDIYEYASLAINVCN
jgi:uncharacterized membrane protein YccF (DUF307 family)